MKPDDIPQGVWDAAGMAAGELTDVIYEFLADKISGKEIDRNDVSIRIIEIISRPVMAEREACSIEGRSAVMKFRGKVGGRYYPGYHEDMRDAVATAIRSRP